MGDQAVAARMLCASHFAMSYCALFIVRDLSTIAL